MERRLDLFNPKYSFRDKVKIGSWGVIGHFVLNLILIPSIVRVIILRVYGAKIGKSVYVRRSVRVYFPWNLTIGSHCWVGEGVAFINHAQIIIGNNVCLSQNVIICSSGHDYKSAFLNYKHKPIRIYDGAWVCLKAMVLPGSEIGVNCVISAGETFSGKLPDNHIYIRGESKSISNSK